MLPLCRPTASWLMTSCHHSPGWLLVPELSCQLCQRLLDWKCPQVWWPASVSLASPTSTGHPTLSPALQRGTSRTFPSSRLGNTLGRTFVLLGTEVRGFMSPNRLSQVLWRQIGRQTSKVCDPHLLSRQQRNLLPPQESHHRQCSPLPGTVVPSHSGIAFRQRVLLLFYRLWGRMDSSHFSLNRTASD